MLTDENTVVPSTTNDATEGSSTSDEGTTETSSDDNVPFHSHPRWKEVMAEKNSLKEELSSLKETEEAGNSKYTDLQAEISQLKEMMTPKKETSQEESIPDYYDDPQGFIEYIENRAVSKIEQKQTSKQKALDEASKFIDSQYTEISKMAEGEVDEEAIGEFAIEYGIMTPDKKGHDLVKAYKLMQAIELAKTEGGKKVLDSVKRGKTPKASNSTSKQSETPNFNSEDVKKMSLDSLLNRLSRN